MTKYAGYTAVAEQEIDHFEYNSSVPVPSILSQGTFQHFAADNIDIIEDFSCDTNCGV